MIAASEKMFGAMLSPFVRQDSPAYKTILRTTLVLAVLCVMAAPLMLYYSTFENVELVRGRHALERYAFSVMYIPIYILHFVLFFAPGFAALYLYSRFRSIEKNDVVMSAATISALTGYIIFWVYFLNPSLGKGVSVLLGFCSVGLLVYGWRHAQSSVFRETMCSRQVCFPLSLMFLSGLLYQCVLFSFDLSHEPSETARLRFLHEFPPDNVLPRFLAERIYDSIDPRPLMDGWQSSDRPPLQAGLVLKQLPFTLLGVFRNYYVMSIIYQCLWIPSLWALCRALKFSERRTLLTFFACLLSGFFLLNSIYVWPKLLAAALVVWAFTLLLRPKFYGENLSASTAAFAALAAALGYLAHGGVAFTLIAMGLFFLIPKFFIGIKNVLVGVVVFILMQVPWMLYQKFYEPPANRLMKWYLAGVVDIDNRTTGQALRDAYSSLTFQEFLAMRWSNVVSLLPDPSLFKSLYHWRCSEFYNLTTALGVLNVSWIVYAMVVLSRKWRAVVPNARASILMVSVALLSLFLWVLIVFGKGVTVNHQGSYATMMLLFAGLANLLFALPRRIWIGLIILHVLDFFIVWIFTTPEHLSLNVWMRSINASMLLLTIPLFALILRTWYYAEPESGSL